MSIRLNNAKKWACNQRTEDADAHFDLGEFVNKQNCRISATENPHACIEKSTRPKRVTVWFGPEA